MADVSYILPELAVAIEDYKVVRDVISGQSAVKRARTTHLPFVGDPASAADLSKYESYLMRAVFANFTSRTLQGLIGQAFAKTPETILPDSLTMLVDNVDGGAVSLEQQAKKVLADVVSIGRAGILPDYPIVSGPVSKADTLSGKVRPVILCYRAEDIINWRVELVNGVRTKTLVVLREKYVSEDDGFKKVEKDMFRVLRLTSQRKYSVQVFLETDTGLKAGPVVFPKQNGKEMDSIPFEFIGSQDNDPNIDPSPLLDLANLNLAHYRNSADFEELVFILSQPTPVIAGVNETWVEEVFGGKRELLLGSSSPIILPEGGSATYLQVTETQLSFQAMEHKERQAVALGARLVQQATVQRTAKEAGMEDASEASLLLSAVTNVNVAYARALKNVVLFMGDTPTKDMKFEINKDLDILRLDNAGRAQLLAEWQRGVLTFSEYRAVLRRVGVATLSYEKARGELEADALANASIGVDPEVQNDGVTKPDNNSPNPTPDAPISGKTGKVK